MRRWLALIRFRHWAHFLALPLGGLVDAPLPSLIEGGIRGALIAAGVLSFGYLLNGICDRHGDLDAAKNPLLDRADDLRSVTLATAALGLGTLAVAGWTSRTALAAAAVCMLSGTVYSAGLRLKALPFVGTLLNVLCFAPLLGVGLAGPSSPGFGTLLAVFTVLLLQNQLVHEAADADEDRRAGSRTTFLTLGPRSTAALALALGAIVPLALIRHGAPGTGALAVLAAAVFAMAVPIGLARGGSRPSRMARLRLLHRWASVLTGGALFLAIRLSA